MLKFDKNILNINDYDALEKANDKEDKRWKAKYRNGALYSSAWIRYGEEKEIERLNATGLGWVRRAEYAGNDNGNNFFLVNDKGVALMMVRGEKFSHLDLEYFIEVLGGIDATKDKGYFDLCDILIDSLAKDPSLLKCIPECVWKIEKFDEKLIKKCSEYKTVKKAMKAVENAREKFEENEM